MQHSIRARLDNALLLYMVVPLLFCGSFLIWQSYVIQRMQALELQRTVADLAVTHVTDFLAKLESELKIATQMQDLVTQNHQERSLTLSKLLSLNSIYSQLTLLHTTGKEQVRVSRQEAISTTDLATRTPRKEFLLPITSQETYFGPVEINITTGEPVMTMAVPVVNVRTGLMTYVLVADIRLRQVWDQIADIQLGNASTIYVVDQDGRLLAHRNPSLVLRGTQVQVPTADGIQAGLSGQVNVVVALPFTVGDQLLHVIIERPLTEALPLTVRLAAVSFFYIFISLLATFHLGKIAGHLLVKPIEALAQTAQAITAGDLSQRAQVYAKNELGAFAHAFNLMTDKWQQSLAELQSSEAGLRRHRDNLERLVDERTAALTQTNQQLEEQSIARRQILSALRESEGRLRTIAEATPVPLVIVRVSDGMILYANMKFGFRHGLSVEQIIGQSVYQLFPNSENIQLLLKKLEAEGAVYEFEMASKSYQDGSLIWTSVTIEFIMFNGAPAYFGVFHDLTERKLIEEALGRKVEELARSNAELERFAYIASHDLQEPLRMVSSYVQLLAHRYQNQLDADADEFITYAVDGTRHMQILINDLLTYSRVSTKGNPFTLVDCGRVLQHALAGLQIAIEESNAAITYDPLPTVLADEMQMHQLFQNLLGNAIKFRGQQPPIIHVGVTHQENGWLFRVQDNGIGLEEKFAERIFVLFQRLHNKVDYPGTGIGLALCKKIIERHDGLIWVESQLAQGSTFYFTLPAAPMPDPHLLAFPAHDNIQNIQNIQGVPSS